MLEWRSSETDVAPVVGWSLPLELDAEGGLPEVRLDPLEDTLRLLLEVSPGERPLVASFGCRVHCLSSVETQEERNLASALIEEALERWLPWLKVRRAEVLSATSSTLRIAIERDSEYRELEIVWRAVGATNDEPHERTKGLS